MHVERDIMRYSRHEMTETEERADNRLDCPAVMMDDTSYCICGDHHYNRRTGRIEIES